MEKFISLFIVLTLIFLCYTQSITADDVYNVADMGAKPDGKTDSTQYFMSAWTSACQNLGPATIIVPQGRFLVNQQARFSGPCNNSALSFQIDGTVVQQSNYSAVADDIFWVGFHGVDGLAIRGGVFDGQGADLWNCKLSNNDCPTGTSTVQFTNSSNIALKGLTSLNSQLYHIVFNGCNNVTIQSVNISAAGNSLNTDGIHVQFSTNVNIYNTAITTGDDCISIGPGTINLWIENVTCGLSGHGISIGSLGREPIEAGVQNVTVKGATFANTLNGLRIKSWPKPSNGFVKDVMVQNATMINVYNPIIIDQNYCPHQICPVQDSGVKVDGVTYQGIHGTSATEVAVKFDCSKSHPCTGIKLEDVNLTYQNRQANASCVNAAGIVVGYIQPPSCFA
ncbi:OLC1v1030377C1 [Oldenlandia corymbosa var. corymbosa]|uniref:OLC1v1030377C1 n=1 Tax=Oldenlandia corymbosa var. corymbosa TaxID=529605 RepID=A0AAV1CIY7_OLDCO|nr:OLC1v1030377C1 [Oldenlandia corymbosa var. corymbosa]